MPHDDVLRAEMNFWMKVMPDGECYVWTGARQGAVRGRPGEERGHFNRKDVAV